MRLFVLCSGSDSKKGKSYALDLQLAHEIDSKTSRHALRRSIEFVLPKKDGAIWWSNLPADKTKYKNVCKADWDKWRDEDEEPIQSDKMGGFGGMDMASMMQGMGGGGGAGGFDPSKFDFSKMGAGADAGVSF